jgi:uncharacterized membrane-anchored protein YhcB (DUF1043 family)
VGRRATGMVMVVVVGRLINAGFDGTRFNKKTHTQKKTKKKLKKKKNTLKTKSFFL